MKHLMLAAAAVSMLATASQRAPESFDPKQIIALERAALDRWGRGDPQGYLEIMAPEVTYFDPSTDKRIDGLPALRAMIEPYTGKIKIDRYEIVNPRVQHHGDVALLTFNLVNYRKLPDGTEQVAARVVPLTVKSTAAEATALKVLNLFNIIGLFVLLLTIQGEMRGLIPCTKPEVGDGGFPQSTVR